MIVISDRVKFIYQAVKMENTSYATTTFKEELKPIVEYAIGNYRYTNTDMARLESKVEYYRALERSELENMGSNKVTYKNIESRFLASLVLTEIPFGAIVGMLRHFPRVFGIASVQSSTVRGIEINACESVEKMLYWIRLVYVSARRMRINLGMRMYEVLAYFEEIGKIGHKPHIVKNAHYRGLLDKPLPLECLFDGDKIDKRNKELNKTEFKLLFLDFYGKLTKKKQAFILSDVRKIKTLSCDDFNLYTATAIVKVRYNRLGQEFARYLEFDNKKVSASEFLLAISSFLA